MSPATMRTLFLTAVGIVVLWLAYLARAVVTPLLVALVLAYILDPVVRLLERRGFTRAAASGTLVVLALGALVAASTIAATQFAQEAAVFYRDVVGEHLVDPSGRDAFVRETAGSEDPSAIADVERRVRTEVVDGRRITWFDRDGDGVYEPGYAAKAMDKIRGFMADSQYAEPLRKALDGVASVGPQIARSADSFLTGLVRGGSAVLSTFLGFVTIVILFPIYLYYSLVNLSRVYDVTVGHLPESQRPRIVEILRKVHVTLSAFFRGRLITMLAKGVLLLVLFVSFGVPFGVVCAAFAAIASLVPVVGGLAAALPPLLLSLPDSTGGQLIGLLAGILVIEGIEGYVLIPALVGNRVGLHPLTVLVCTLVAADLLGFFGMVVAVPLTAVLKILASEFVLPEVRRRAGLPPRPDETPSAAPPGASDLG